MRHSVVRLAVLIGLVGMPSAYVAAQPGARESDGAGTITRFEFNVPHTTIRFSAEFLGIVKVEGRFNDFYGSFLYDEDDFTQSSLHVVVLSSSVDSNAEGRDQDLRSDRFLDIIRFPGATFRSRRIEARGNGYVAIGDLTIRDVTKEIEVPFKITGRTTWFSGVRLMGIEAGFTFNRQDFGMAWEQIIDDGSLFAGNEVRIDAKVGLAEVQANELDAEETYPAVTLSEAALRRFTGTYVQRDPVQEIQVALIGGHLVAQMQGDGQTTGFSTVSPGRRRGARGYLRAAEIGRDTTCRFDLGAHLRRVPENHRRKRPGSGPAIPRVQAGKTGLVCTLRRARNEQAGASLPARGKIRRGDSDF